MVELAWQAEHGEDEVVFRLEGAISEAAELTPLLEQAGRRVRIDLSGIERINSSGVREWIGFITKLCEGREVVLERCAVPIVRQLNMISNMAGSSSIRSVMLPYYCNDCDCQASVICDLDEGKPQIAESIPCRACDGTMEFDEIPESYLSFLRG